MACSSKDVPIRWLYTLILVEDANFKQKARLRSGKNVDLPLGPGWGTFILNKPYLDYVSKFACQDEVCVHHLLNSGLSDDRILCKFISGRFHIAWASLPCRQQIQSMQKGCRQPGLVP